MTHRTRSGSKSANRPPSPTKRSQYGSLRPARKCPWCESQDTDFVKRGFAGGQESKDQYIRCHDCGRVTYDIVAKTDREIRIRRYQAGGQFNDPEHKTRYTIYRMLKVGFDEFLLYLRPHFPEDSDQT